MIRYGTGANAYVQASGFVNESWRDVYKFLNTLTVWPTQPSYNRVLTITARGSDIAAYNTTGYGILYGTHPTTVGDYSNWLVYSFDGGGDTWAYLTTGVVTGNAANGESDIGIGESELGPANGSIFPGDNFATDVNSNDAGSNASTAGSGTTFANIPFSLWINN